jgi:hypothetical protein
MKLPLQEIFTIKCPRCGPFNLTVYTEQYVRGALPSQQTRNCWTITSHAIRRFVPGARPPLVDEKWLKSVWSNEGLPGPKEQADTLVDLGSQAIVPSKLLAAIRRNLLGFLAQSTTQHEVKQADSSISSTTC